MSSWHMGDVPTWIAGIGSLAAVITAVAIAISGNKRDNRLRGDDRREAAKQLTDERAIAQKNLVDERDRADQQRRSDHLTHLLLEVYDLYAAYVRPGVSPSEQNEVLFRLHPRLAVLPAELAVAVRIGIADTTSSEAMRNKAGWLRHRLGRGAPLASTDIGWDVVSREAEFDLWWVRQDEPPRLDRQPYPWHDFELLRDAEG